MTSWERLEPGSELLQGQGLGRGTYRGAGRGRSAEQRLAFIRKGESFPEGKAFSMSAIDSEPHVYSIGLAVSRHFLLECGSK